MSTQMQYQFLSPNIGVSNVGETVKFYTEVLGFQLVMSNPAEGVMEWAMVSNGAVSFMFQEKNSLMSEYEGLNNSSSTACLTFYLKVQGMAELYKKLQNTQYLVKEMHTTFYGADEFAIQDNNGFILTITEDK